MAISENVRGAALMSLSMFAFTVNDAFIKSVTEVLPLYQTIALRGVVAVAGLLLVAHFTGSLRVKIARADARLIMWRSLADVVATVLFLTALQNMYLANLSAILQATPLAVTLGAALMFKDPIGWRRMTAILIGFIGVLIIINPQGDGFDGWALVGLAAVGAIVLRDLAVRPLSRQVPSIMVALGAGAAVFVLGIVGSVIQGWAPVTPLQLSEIFASGVLLTVGYLTAVLAMRVGDIGFVAPFRYSSLLWAIFLGWLVFGNLPQMNALIGAAIVVATGIYTLLRERNLRQAAARRT
jgi:drug/metabolite transporter (DMT)-like permease